MLVIEFACVAHVINLTIQDGLNKLVLEFGHIEEDLSEELLKGSMELILGPSFNNKLGNLLVLVRKLIIMIKVSLQRIKQYENLCNDLCKLKVDCVARWNSTFEMLFSSITEKPVSKIMVKKVLNMLKQFFTL